MKKLIAVLFAPALLFGNAWAQGSAQSMTMALPHPVTVNVAAVNEDYFPLLQRTEAPFPGGNSEKARIEALKAGLDARYGQGNGHAKVDSTAPSPWFGVNFQSNNVINGVPNDNDMAISNGGKVVSVINSNIYMHNEDGSALANISLDAWSNSLGITGSKFDPRALYDPIHDRFVISCLNGFTDSTSYLIVGFSQSNDPTGNWNLYALPGDPLQDSLWTDYPIMALTENELFITVNLLYNDQPWQTGFNQSICWQLSLDSAYAGNTLANTLWYNIQFGGAPIRNLCPIQGGSAPAGPNLYLLSNRNFASSNDTVFIMEITDSLNGPSPQFLVDYKLSNQPYGLAPNAVQILSQQLATNDSRWLDGFIENGNIQFVGNSIDPATGRPGFYHGIVADVAGARTVTGRVLGHPVGSYGYPAIAWMGMQGGSDEALMAINYAGTTNVYHPGCGAIYYDGIGDYSPLVVCRSGASYINAITGIDRWGDYTGVQTRYNNPGEVWMAATFGKSDRTPGTWVAAYHHPSIVSNTETLPKEDFGMAFPNPSQDMTYFEFELEEAKFLEIALYDGQGRLVKMLVRDLVRSGKNRIHFSLNPLASGTYFLKVSENGQSLHTSKIVKH